MTEPQVTTSVGKASVWEDFVDIFHQPSAVFDRRRDGQFGLALAVLAIVTGILAFALQNGLAPLMDAIIAKQQAAVLAKNPSITAEQLASMSGFMEMSSKFGAILFVPIGALITGVLVWLIGKFVDAKTVFAAAMMIAVYSLVPSIVKTVVTALQGLLMSPESITGPNSVSIGPARFLPESANPILATLLGGFDLFSLWMVVLVAIGVSVVARVPMKRATIVAGFVWVAGLLPALYAAISQAP